MKRFHERFPGKKKTRIDKIFSMSYGRGPPPDIRGMTSLKVDNLTYRTTPEDLRRTFTKYGKKRKFKMAHLRALAAERSESELFTGDTSKDNHSPGPVFREVSP